MLTGKDLGQAIAKAMTLKGVKAADLARHFKVKPPSVNGWIKTGRIGKDKLYALFEYFADVVGPEHWGINRSNIGSATPTSEPPRPPVIDEETWRSLPPKARALIEEVAGRSRSGDLDDEALALLLATTDKLSKGK